MQVGELPAGSPWQKLCPGASQEAQLNLNTNKRPLMTFRMSAVFFHVSTALPIPLPRFIEEALSQAGSDKRWVNQTISC